MPALHIRKIQNPITGSIPSIRAEFRVILTQLFGQMIFNTIIGSNDHLAVTFL